MSFLASSLFCPHTDQFSLVFTVCNRARLKELSGFLRLAWFPTKSGIGALEAQRPSVGLELSLLPTTMCHLVQGD